MLQDGEERQDNQNNFLKLDRNGQIVIAVCVTLSMLFMKTGFLSFFFLAPLGYAIIVTGSFLIVFAAAASVNIFISVLVHQFSVPNNNLFLDIFYFTTLILLFTLILGLNKRYVNNVQNTFLSINIRTAFRFIIASVAGAIAFLIYILSSRNNSEFNSLLTEMSKVVSSMVSSYEYKDETGQLVFTPERVQEMIKNISLRGGAFVSVLSVFFINYQLTFIAVRLIVKNTQEYDVGLMRFFAPRDTVWIFAGALVTALITGIFNFTAVNIIAWNVLVICAVLFLGQGFGIILFQIAIRKPLFRMAAGLSILILLISPLNAIALIGLFLLGIAETWLPLRVNKVIS
ncbi:MAG: YybS family protein [Treponema sp.]|nr:YybS family protein [Treponema sp.]